MREVKSDEARRAFSALIDAIRLNPAEAVTIQRYDKPVAVIVSAAWYDAVADHLAHPQDQVAEVLRPAMTEGRLRALGASKSGDER